MHFKKAVMPVYGDMMTPKTRAVLRSPDHCIIDGAFYEYTEHQRRNSMPPRKLREEEIIVLVYDSYFEPIVDAAGGREQYWMGAERTVAEYNVDNSVTVERNWQFAYENSREVWTEKAKQFYGPNIGDEEIDLYIGDNETKEQRKHREFRDWQNGISSFKPGPFSWMRDHQVNKVIKWVVIAYVVYNYTWVLYAYCAWWLLIRAIGVVLLVRKFKKAAQRPFVPDPRSRYSEEWQRGKWEDDRRWWGYDKDDEKKNNKKK